MQTIDGIPIWGAPVDEGALSQIRNCAKTRQGGTDGGSS
jgi:hypothetical protein